MEDNFEEWLNTPDHPCSYVCQLEVCPETHRKHWQGYAVFKKVMRFSALKKIHETMHWENRKGTHKQAYDYCIKEDTRMAGVDPVIRMEYETLTGKRTDLKEARPAILAHSTWKDVVMDEELVEVLAKYPKWVREVYDNKPIIPLAGVTLRPWQQEMMLLLDSSPDSRKIHWYYDSIGNYGKSFMATYLAKNHAAIVFSNGKSSDVAFALDSPPIVVWDLSRSQEESTNYGVMEDVKNGRIFSPKYGSVMKIFPIPHLFVFANFKCPPGKFSEDRIELHELSISLPSSPQVNPFKRSRGFAAGWEDGDNLAPFEKRAKCSVSL